MARGTRAAPPAAGHGGSWLAVLTLLVLPLAAHLTFSTLGFNPTDDGFVLAASRRLLDGEVPHRDFISIRPAGSPLLHAPEVLFGGAATFWIARGLVWLEIAWIAWAWTQLARSLPGRRASTLAAFSGAAIAFVLTSHTFPVMPWHTTDGLALVSAGLLLARSSLPPTRLAGYALLGASALCKQNFVVAVPLAMAILGDWRRWSCWAAALAPLLLYGGFLLTMRAGAPALAQMGSQSDFVTSGVLPFVSNLWFVVGLGTGLLALGLGLTGLRGRPLRARAAWMSGAVVVAVGMLGAGLTVDRGRGLYSDGGSFLLFGMALGALASCAATLGARDPCTRLGALAVSIAWAASVSVGYRTPALASAPLAIFLIASASAPFRRAEPSRRATFPAVTFALVALALVSVWFVARLRFVYRDRPAWELTRRLDDVLPGGRFLRTNENTFELMADLERAIQLTRGRPFAIVADFAAYWVKAPRRNPLPIDWPQTTELNRPELMDRVTRALEARRGAECVIVQRTYTANVPGGFRPLRPGNPYYYVVDFVRGRFRRTGETTYFDIYE